MAFERKEKKPKIKKEKVKKESRFSRKNKKSVKSLEFDIRSNYESLLKRQKVKKSRSTKVNVKGRWVMELLETILTVSKLIITIFMIISVSIFAFVDPSVRDALKIATYSLTTIFIIFDLSTTLIDKIIIRVELNNIWGVEKKIIGEYIETKSFTSKATLKKKADIDGSFSVQFNNKINIFDNKLKISFKDIFVGDESLIEDDWVVYKADLDISINQFYVELRNREVSIFLEIDLPTKKCSWSGKLPINSNYGYWYWDTTLEKTEALLENEEVEVKDIQ